MGDQTGRERREEEIDEVWRGLGMGFIRSDQTILAQERREERNKETAGLSLISL
jgi:hypothetical protein